MGADESEIRNFLKQFKKIASRKGISLIPRETNIKALAELGLTKKEAKQEIMTLSVIDYCRGPEPDHTRPGEVWFLEKRSKKGKFT